MTGKTGDMRKAVGDGVGALPLVTLFEYYCILFSPNIFLILRYHVFVLLPRGYCLEGS